MTALTMKTMAKMECNKHITPVIIKYPFWRMTNEWQDAAYACLNYNEAYAPEGIRTNRFAWAAISEMF